jgi:hypothetical protein
VAKLSFALDIGYRGTLTLGYGLIKRRSVSTMLGLPTLRSADHEGNGVQPSTIESRNVRAAPIASPIWFCCTRIATVNFMLLV